MKRGTTVKSDNFIEKSNYPTIGLDDAPDSVSWPTFTDLSPREVAM